MNRRRFLGFLAAGAVAVGATTRLAETQISVAGLSNHDAMLALLQKRMKEAEQGLVQALSTDLYSGGSLGFYSGYDILEIKPQDVLQAAEFTWSQASVEIFTSKPRSKFLWLTQIFRRS